MGAFLAALVLFRFHAGDTLMRIGLSPCARGRGEALRGGRGPLPCAVPSAPDAAIAGSKCGATLLLNAYPISLPDASGLRLHRGQIVGPRATAPAHDLVHRMSIERLSRKRAAVLRSAEAPRRLPVRGGTYWGTARRAQATSARLSPWK